MVIYEFQTFEDSLSIIEDVFSGEVILAETQVWVNGEKLTPKMVKFAKEYVKDFCITKAAVRAGYSKSTANSFQSDFFTRSLLQELIRFETKRQNVMSDIDTQRVLEEINKVAMGDPRRTMAWDDFGITVKRSDEIPDDVAACIKEVYTDAKGQVRLKFHDKVKALEMLARHLDIIDDKLIDKESMDKLARLAVGLEPEMTEEEATRVFLEKTTSSE